MAVITLAMLWLLFFFFVPSVAATRDAFYILFDYDIEDKSWPVGFEKYELFVVSPQNMTRSLLDKVRRTVRHSKCVLYFDTMDIPIKHGCSTGHVMGDKPSRNCSTSYRCGKGPWTEALNKAFKPEWTLRQLHHSGTATTICTYPGLAHFVPFRESVSVIVSLLKEWVDTLGADGIYFDNRLRSSLYAKVCAEQLTQYGTIDSNGDGQVDSIEDVIDQYVSWSSVLTHELRLALGSDAVMIGNSAGALSDPSLSGITIEMESCTDLSRCRDALVAQHAASQGLRSEKRSVLWLTHSETVPPKVQCERARKLQEELPYLLQGTDFFDGSHVTCA
jgi:hypothetical protein